MPTNFLGINTSEEREFQPIHLIDRAFTQNLIANEELDLKPKPQTLS